MNSRLYECDIMHCRIKPKRHRFMHRIFMFYLDVDEIDALAEKLPLLSRNRSNMFSFFDRDHLECGGVNVRENIIRCLARLGFHEPVGRMMLLTNLRTMGYVFNPVSFFYCYDLEDKPLCVLVEIGNTFGELKPFLLGPESFKNGVFDSRQVKYYYISPFIDLDIPLHFQLRVPGERLNIKIDDVGRDGEKFLYTTMSGPERALTSANLWRYAITFPFVTLKVIGLIHIHALLLWFKKIPHHAKEANARWQKGVYRAWVKK